MKCYFAALKPIFFFLFITASTLADEFRIGNPTRKRGADCNPSLTGLLL